MPSERTVFQAKVWGNDTDGLLCCVNGSRSANPNSLCVDTLFGVSVILGYWYRGIIDTWLWVPNPAGVLWQNCTSLAREQLQTEPRSSGLLVFFSVVAIITTLRGLPATPCQVHFGLWWNLCLCIRQIGLEMLDLGQSFVLVKWTMPLHLNEHSGLCPLWDKPWDKPLPLQHRLLLLRAILFKSTKGLTSCCANRLIPVIPQGCQLHDGLGGEVV